MVDCCCGSETGCSVLLMTAMATITRQPPVIPPKMVFPIPFIGSLLYILWLKKNIYYLNAIVKLAKFGSKRITLELTTCFVFSLLKLVNN